jgi:hypothetical protein
MTERRGGLWSLFKAPEKTTKSRVTDTHALSDDVFSDFGRAERLGREPLSEVAVEAWKNDFVELLRLHLQELNPGIDESELLEMISDRQQLFGFDELLSSLTQNEFTPNHHLWLLSELLLEELIKLKLLPSESQTALIPLGGAVHGGGALKLAFHLSVIGGEDLDVGLVFDRETLSPAQLDKISNVADQFLQRRTGGRMRLCKEITPASTFNYNLADVEEAKQLLLNWEGLPEGWRYGDHLLLYFYPSLPEEVNLRNTDLLLEALQQISHTHPQRWEELVQNLFTAWGQVHSIKEKHLVRESIWQTQSAKVALAAKIVCKASRVMGQPMLRLLESTRL